MFNDFANWKIANPGKIPDQDDKDALKVYMKEKYAMTPGKGSILDTIKGMNSPPMGEAKKENSATVVSTLASCSKRAGNKRRKKRSNEGGSEIHVGVMHKRSIRKYLKNYLLQFMQGK